MDAHETPESQPIPFLYAMLLPIVWLGIGLIVNAIAPGFRLGLSGSIVLFTVVCVGICWLFLQRNGRMPNNSESWRLVIYCSVFAIVLESWVMLAALTWPEIFPEVQLDAETVKIAIGVAIVLDTLIMTLAFRVAAPRWLNSTVDKMANQSSDGD